MKRLWKWVSPKQCAVICAIVFLIMFGSEAVAVQFYEKHTPPFLVLMGIVLICPFVFTFFLKGVWREPDKSDKQNNKKVCVLMGSPRKNGNTMALLRPFLSEFENSSYS